jgi:hypothetical protein
MHGVTSCRRPRCNVFSSCIHQRHSAVWCANTLSDDAPPATGSAAALSRSKRGANAASSGGGGQAIALQTLVHQWLAVSRCHKSPHSHTDHGKQIDVQSAGTGRKARARPQADQWMAPFDQPLAKRCTISIRLWRVVRAFLWMSIRGSRLSIGGLATTAWSPRGTTSIAATSREGRRVVAPASKSLFENVPSRMTWRG